MSKKGVNLVILVGNLGKDPETKYLPSGAAVTNATLATSKSRKERETGEQKERTEWHRLVFFNKLAEIAGQYLKKGSKIYLQGELVTRQWEKDGQKHYTTEVHVNELQFLDSRGEDAGKPHRDEDQDSRPTPKQAPAAADFDNDPDSIPF